MEVNPSLAWASILLPRKNSQISLVGAYNERQGKKFYTHLIQNLILHWKPIDNPLWLGFHLHTPASFLNSRYLTYSCNLAIPDVWTLSKSMGMPHHRPCPPMSYLMGLGLLWDASLDSLLRFGTSGMPIDLIDREIPSSSRSYISKTHTYPPHFGYRLF